MNKPHPDTVRLKALIAIAEDHAISLGSDFDQMLFFARRKTKTTVAAYRRALNQWIKDGRA